MILHKTHWNEPCNKSMSVIKFRYDRSSLRFWQKPSKKGRADMSKYWEEKFRPEDLQRLRGLRLMDDDFMSNCFEEKY